jgi:hypothetical protein
MAAAGLNPAGQAFLTGQTPGLPVLNSKGARNYLPAAALQMPAPLAVAAEPKEFR